MQMDDTVRAALRHAAVEPDVGTAALELRYHSQVFNLSQFLHGEQGALICAARIVQDVPTIESKFYAATQVMDEARHVEGVPAAADREIQVRLPDLEAAQDAWSSRR
jgi:hypothetical protein